MALFYAYKALQTPVPTYFIESTAPDNVDAPPAPPIDMPDRLQYIEDADDAITDIARELAGAKEPNLVVMVHGFSNPQPDALRLYASAADAIARDPAICARPGLVCIGYRWPSEHMGQPLRGTWAALPLLPTWLLWVGIALVLVLAACLYFWVRGRFWQGFDHVAVLLAWILPGLVITAALLRAAAYFRDNYRAQTYGAPDLIEIIRKIDGRMVDKHGWANRSEEDRVQLSFIGHSMGGFVVTNAIRVLSDLFKTDAKYRRPRLNDGVINRATEQQRVARERDAGEGAARSRPPASPQIGNVFKLMRFVLVSPDIPAEALLSNRANFLQASLLRFDEAFLFSNEGDEVLRQISTIANYFSFPTRTWKHGFRLGNVEILSSGYGVINPSPGEFLKTLRIGYYTLDQLYTQLIKPRGEAPDEFDSVQKTLPKVFTYFDHTDYVDRKYRVPTKDWGPATHLLTYALRTKRSDPRKGLSPLQHLRLLLSYPRINCHGGYFEGELSQQIMYRLACLGYQATVHAYGNIGLLSAQCEEKQIRVLLSPELTHPHQRHAAGHRAPADVEYIVPDVSKMTVDDAKSAISRPRQMRADGVTLDINPHSAAPVTRRVNVVEQESSAPAGTVIGQNPPAGKFATCDSEIVLTVAKAAR